MSLGSIPLGKRPRLSLRENITTTYVAEALLAQGDGVGDPPLLL